MCAHVYRWNMLISTNEKVKQKRWLQVNKKVIFEVRLKWGWGRNPVAICGRFLILVDRTARGVLFSMAGQEETVSQMTTPLPQFLVCRDGMVINDVLGIWVIRGFEGRCDLMCILNQLCWHTQVSVSLWPLRASTLLYLFFFSCPTHLHSSFYSPAGPPFSQR